MSETGPGKRRREFEPLPEWVHPGTRLLHGARRPDYNAGAIAPPIYQTSTFRYPAEFSEMGDGEAYLYTRMRNPTQEVAAELIRGLEGGEAARVFGSGMGAMTTTLLSFLSPGDEVVAIESLYGGTLDLLTTLLPRLGIHVRWVRDEEAAEPERAIGPGTRVAVLESPTNPLLRVNDIQHWAEATDRAGALLVVDNTFATPINQTPIRLGADLVVHSATKYLGGHSDIIAGAVVGPTALLGRIDRTHEVIGSSLDPFAAFLLARGMRTLDLRVRRQNENAARLAEAFSTHPKVARVYYPGRGSDGEEAIARRQMLGRGGMVSFELAGGLEAAHRFLHHVRFVQVASSLGGVESLASLPRETSHRHLSDDERARRGIADGLVRLSTGVEDVEDLERDLREAFDAI